MTHTTSHGLRTSWRVDVPGTPPRWQRQRPELTHRPHHNPGGFVCCVVTDETDHVVKAAPIMRWALGLPLAAVQHWVRQRDGEMERL